MTILDQLFKPQFRATAIKDLTVKQINTGLLGLPLIFNSDQTVATEKTALTLSAFYNAIDILSDDIAKLPKHVFKKEGENRNKFTEHHINYLINTRPNAKMTAYTLWKTAETLRLLKGNAYIHIVRNSNTGKAIALELLNENNKEVKIYETEEKLYYKHGNKIYPSEDILHFIGFTLDGKKGCGVVTYAAAQLGVALENQKYGETVYKNRGVSYGVLESDNSIEENNKELLSKGFTSKLSQQDPHKAPVLDEGIKYKSISITPAEAEFLATNKQGVIEVCRWLNIAPHLLKDLTSANYSNIYQQSIEHVQLSVLPRVIAKEQELNHKLFTTKERETTYIKFNIAVLLRGDLAAKAAFYTAMVYAGIYTRNEIRELEDRNPIDGLNEPLQPVNMQPLSMAMELQKQAENGNNNTNQ